MIKKELVPSSSARFAHFEYRYAGTNNEMPPHPYHYSGVNCQREATAMNVWMLTLEEVENMPNKWFVKREVELCKDEVSFNTISNWTMPVELETQNKELQDE